MPELNNIRDLFDVSGAKASEPLKTLIYFCRRMEPAAGNLRDDSAKGAAPAVVQAATNGGRAAKAVNRAGFAGG